MTVDIGILLALACALTTNLGFLYKHRGATRAPDVDWHHPLRSAAGLFRSKWFAIGMAVAVGAWLLHVAAMALAPLSIVQAVISGGLVCLTVLAERFFGFSVGKRQWLGVGFTALGLATLAVTLPGAADAHSSYSTPGMIAFESGLLVAGTVLVLFPKFGAPREHHGALLGASAGILFGVSDVAIKALTGGIGTDGLVGGLLSPWLLTAVLASVIAFFASARGLQTGDAVPVITVTSAAATMTSIAGGIVVFGDPMPSDPVALVAQCFAFLLVIAAAALTPAPLRAAASQSA
jgi:drug/metabolite transporter (DMT)-like permease